jgi:hypothetical protein
MTYDWWMHPRLKISQPNDPKIVNINSFTDLADRHHTTFFVFDKTRHQHHSKHYPNVKVKSMKDLGFTVVCATIWLNSVVAFTVPTRSLHGSAEVSKTVASLCATKEPKEKERTESGKNLIDMVNGDSDLPIALSDTKDSKELPWWWDLIWDLDMMKKGEPGSDMLFGDTANVLRTNIEQIYGGAPSLDGCPLAEGEITDIAEGTMFIGLQNYFQSYGSPYKVSHCKCSLSKIS